MNVFLVTRPIQYINVLNLPFEIRDAILLIQNSFSTFNLIYDIAKKDKKRWSKIIVLNTNRSIFRWLFRNRHTIDSFNNLVYSLSSIQPRNFTSGITSFIL